MRETSDELSKGILSTFHVLKGWGFTEEEVRGALGFPFGSQLEHFFL